MADLDLDTAEPLNVSIPYGEVIDVEMQATDDNDDPLTLTGVWNCDVYDRYGIKVLALTSGTGFNIAGSTLTLHFGYIAQKIKQGDFYWRMRKVEGGLSAPIWKGFLIVTK